MSTKDIYARLRTAGLTHEGACGLMGNMQAESAMQSNIAQRGMTAMSDADYTAAADMGAIDFASDAVGYGLCQWTYHTRKRALLDFAHACGVSVGDEAMQVEFCLAELRRDYPALFAALCTSGDIYDCTARVCREYERPAVNNINLRTYFALTFADADQAQVESWDKETPAEPEAERYWPPRMLDYREGRINLTGADVLVLQALLTARGYNCPTSGDFDGETRAALLEYQDYNGLVVDGVAGDATWTRLLRR